MKTRLLPAALAVSALVVAGCGGDGGGSGEPPAPTPTPTVTVNGVVLDGPLENAKVCQDRNDNRACDTDEPSATTTAAGTYELKVPEGSEGQYPLVVEATAGSTLDADTGPVAASFRLVAPAGLPAVISPYTTLVQSELDSGRAPNLRQAEENILFNMVGTAGDVGGLTLYSNFQPDASDTTAQATRRARMAGMAQLLAQAFAKTELDSGLSGKDLSAALGQVATGSLQQVLFLVPGRMTAEARDALFTAQTDSLVPTASHLADVRAAAAKTTADPIEGAWVRTVDLGGGVTAKYLFILAGDGTFVHQTLDPGVPTSTWTPFDEGYGYRYGRYSYSSGTLTTTLIEAAAAAGPGTAPMTGVTVSGNTLTADGGVTYTRVASETNPLVGGWIRPNGSSKPEYFVAFEDGTYFHSTFYYQNDPQTGTATYFETAKSAGVRKGSYERDAATNVVSFGATTVSFNGNLAIPGNPGVGILHADGSLSMTGLRLVKLGSTEGASAITGLSEATRSRLWSGRYFSRSVNVGGLVQYAYVRGPNDVVYFRQAASGSDTSLACSTAGVITDFSSVAPDDGQLKHFVVGTSTTANSGYIRRRLNVGQPGAGNFMSYTPVTRPTNAANQARCVAPS